MNYVYEVNNPNEKKINSQNIGHKNALKTEKKEILPNWMISKI